MTTREDIAAIFNSMPRNLRIGLKTKSGSSFLGVFLVVDDEGACWWQEDIGPCINFYPETDIFKHANPDTDNIPDPGYTYAINVRTGDVHRRTFNECGEVVEVVLTADLLAEYDDFYGIGLSTMFDSKAFEELLA